MYVAVIFHSSVSIFTCLVKQNKHSSLSGLTPGSGGNRWIFNQSSAPLFTQNGFVKVKMQYLQSYESFLRFK